MGRVSLANWVMAYRQRAAFPGESRHRRNVGFYGQEPCRWRTTLVGRIRGAPAKMKLVSYADGTMNFVVGSPGSVQARANVTRIRFGRYAGNCGFPREENHEEIEQGRDDCRYRCGGCPDVQRVRASDDRSRPHRQLAERRRPCLEERHERTLLA